MHLTDKLMLSAAMRNQDRRPPRTARASSANQKRVLGIGADSYNGLIVVEIDGPPIVALTPREARSFALCLERAYRDAIDDADTLGSPAARDVIRHKREAA